MKKVWLAILLLEHPNMRSFFAGSGGIISTKRG